MIEKKPQTVKQKCCNCGRDHFSISKRCSKNPNNSNNRKEWGEPKVPKQRKQWPKTSEMDEKEGNVKRVNTEDELNLALGAMLRDYIALNAAKDMQRNVILQSKKIVDEKLRRPHRNSQKDT